MMVGKAIMASTMLPEMCIRDSFQGFFHPLTDEGVIGDAIHTESVGNVLEDAFWERIGPLEHLSLIHI